METPTSRKRKRVNGDGGLSEAELGSSISRSARMRAMTTDEEDEHGSSSASSAIESDGEASAAVAQLLSASASKTAMTRHNGTSKAFVTASAGEAYLHAMSRPAKTSNKKLSESFTSGQDAFTQSTYLAALAAADKTPRALELEQKLSELERAYAALHDQWYFELSEGFSIFFYGLGSKIRVLENFVDVYLKKRGSRQNRGKVIVVNGYMATLGIDDLLTALEDIVQPLNEEGFEEDVAASARLFGKSAAKLDERAKAIADALNSSTSHYHAKRPIYLLIHNIDGLALRSFRSQAILSLLVSQPAIRLLASIDHVKAPLLFPSSIASSRPSLRPGSGNGNIDTLKRGYNVIYHHIPTHRPYTAESLLSGTMASIFPPTLFISDISAASASGGGSLAGASSESRAKAAFFVLASLTQKSKDVFTILAERQISLAPSSRSSARASRRQTSLDPEKTPSHATLYSALFSLARDRFLANNVNQFEALLREFRDHSVILSSQTPPEGGDNDEVEPDGVEDVGNRNGEWIWIGIEKEDLEGLLEKMAS